MGRAGRNRWTWREHAYAIVGDIAAILVALPLLHWMGVDGALLVGVGVVLAFLGAIWVLARVRLGPKPGHCRCGYDLSGIEGYLCPECGRERAGD